MRKIFRLILILVIGMSLFTSCAKLRFSNLLKNKYGYVEYPSKSKKVLKVNVGVLPVVPVGAASSEKPLMFTDLRDSLPHLYMEHLSAKESNPEKFIELLKKQLSNEPQKKQEKLKTDYHDIVVRLVFSNIKEYFNGENGIFMHPNTRMEFLNTSIELNDKTSDAYFYSIDKLENEFEDIDLGTAERTQDVKFDTKLSVEGGLGVTNGGGSTEKNISKDGDSYTSTKNVYDKKGNLIGTIVEGNLNEGNSENTNQQSSSQEAKIGAKAEASYMNSESIKEAVAIKLKRLKVGYSFSSKNITLSQRGRVLGDISDNVYITATLRLKNTGKNLAKNSVVQLSENLYINSIQNKADDIQIKRNPITYIPCGSASDIPFTVKYSGAIRAVNNKWGHNSRSALEYDDNITFYRIDGDAEINPVIDKNQFCKREYRITCKLLGDATNTLYILYIENPNNEPVRLFTDHNPLIFHKWIVDAVTNPSKVLLETKKLKLFFEDNARANPIFLVNSTINAAAINKIKTIDPSSIALEEVP